MRVLDFWSVMFGGAQPKVFQVYPSQGLNNRDDLDDEAPAIRYMCHERVASSWPRIISYHNDLMSFESGGSSGSKSFVLGSCGRTSLSPILLTT